jgi:hypothetical protein
MAEEGSAVVPAAAVETQAQVEAETEAQTEETQAEGVDEVWDSELAKELFAAISPAVETCDGNIRNVLVSLHFTLAPLLPLFARLPLVPPCIAHLLPLLPKDLSYILTSLVLFRSCGLTSPTYGCCDTPPYPLLLTAGCAAGARLANRSPARRCTYARAQLHTYTHKYTHMNTHTHIHTPLANTHKRPIYAYSITLSARILLCGRLDCQ